MEQKNILLERILQRQKTDVTYFQEIFCSFNLDAETKIDDSKIYLIPCSVDSNHGIHIIAPSLLREVKKEFKELAINFYKRNSTEFNLTKSELEPAKSLVYRTYLNEAIEKFTADSRVDKQVNKYLSSSGFYKRRKNRPRNKVTVTHIVKDVYEIRTPKQTKKVTESQVKEFFTCYSKKGYITASQAKNSLSANLDDTLSVYLCVYCTGFHLGHEKVSKKAFRTASKFTYRYKLKPKLGETFLNTIKN